MGASGKKRGRPRKKRPEDAPGFWEKQLHHHRLGKHRAESKSELLACFFVNKKAMAVPIEQIGTGESRTQRTDELVSLHLEAAENEKIVLSEEWKRYMEYMDVVAEALSPGDKGVALKKLFLADARSRYWEQPPDMLRPMNASLGTPAEFRERWFYGELEIYTCARNRRERIIEIWRLPPAEQDLDEAGEPAGHWEGLKWISDNPKNNKL